MATIAAGGALRASLARRLMKLATSDAGRCDDARKVFSSRKKRERCLECSRSASRREYSLG